MATTEMSTAATDGGQQEEMLSPPEEDTSSALKSPSAPLNFSELTPRQFGISVQSFTPAASSNRKDKSRLAEIKERRRSTIGVRGSPETNSLICFIAQQRMKTPKTLQTPEHVRSSPFFPRVASSLRQKMASFQSLMDVEESEFCDPMPRQDSDSGGCIKTRDYLSDRSSKENYPPTLTPTPKKRRRLGSVESCEVEIREAGAPIPHFGLNNQEEDEGPVVQVLTERPSTSTETVEKVQTVLISPLQRCDSHLQDRHHLKDSVFELASPSQPPPDDPAAASAALPASPVCIPSLPSLLEIKPTGEDDSTGTSTVKKKKRVHFGGPLSPEFFDKNLPPSTPLQKGATPARAQTPGGGFQLRSVLKTPQRSDSQTPLAQLDLCSPTMFGASPTLAMPRNYRARSVDEDCEDKDSKIFFPSMDEIDSAVTGNTEYMWNSQPLNLDTAFHEESLSQIVAESETERSTVCNTQVVDAPVTLPEKEQLPEANVEAPAPVRSTNRRKKQPEPVCESTSEAPARSSSRKRKQAEECEPVKRSTRSAAKSASGKMKATSTATRRWNRDVDRSLYGSRAYASKNPNLSPITERLSFINKSPAAQHDPSTSRSAPEASNPETSENPEMSSDSKAISDLSVTRVLENPAEDSHTSSNPSKEMTRRKVRRLSGREVRGRGLKRMKVSVPECDLLSEEPRDQTEGPAEEHTEDLTTMNLEASNITSLNLPVPEQEGADAELNAEISADATSTDSDGKRSECDADLNVDSQSDKELNYTLNLPAEPDQRSRRGRRSAVINSVPLEQGDQVEEHNTSLEAEAKRQREQTVSDENHSRSSSNSQEEEEEGGVPHLDLASWQAEYNFEDVFKPVATRGQRSVRRSQRNQSNTAQGNNSTGLVWLPHTSPDFTKESRRKTRGRRLSAALPAQPPVSEDTEDNNTS